MYKQLKSLCNKYKLNRTLIQSIIIMALGAHILGGICLYNCIKANTSLQIYARDSEKEALGDVTIRLKRVRHLLRIGTFFVALKAFFIFILLWGAALTANDYLNYYQAFMH